MTAISASRSAAPRADPQKLVLAYGGTFDPIHHGHLRLAVELTQWLPVLRLHLLPCQQPPHRAQPSASPEARLAMLRLAVAQEPLLYVDARELQRSGPSWTVDTLRSLRADYGHQQPLALVLGWDAFLGWPGWKEKDKLLSLAHLILVARPGDTRPPNAELHHLLKQHQCRNAHALTEQAAGSIFRLTLPSSLQISATFVRRLLHEGRSVRYLLPDAVIDYLSEQGLYAPAPSRSTDQETHQTPCPLNPNPLNTSLSNPSQSNN